MNIRRQPFQFTTIDPAKRQAELQKRFGLPSNDMYVDCVNPGIMGAGNREPSSVGSSPRLQHRVPMFTQGFEPTKSSDHQNNVDAGYKPRVRVIPIQVEGVDKTKRHRTFSGPAGSMNDAIQNDQVPDAFQPLNSLQINGEMKNPNQPKVCNIPIKIEHKESKKDSSGILSNKRKLDVQKPKTEETNGCAFSKAEEKPAEPNVNISLKQIENVLNKLKTYHEEVEKFTGGPKDKQYRYLDEMLTRCMLDLDDVETLGKDDIRQARKAAVRKVQASVDLLESKINMQSLDKEQTSAEKKDTVEDAEMSDIQSQGDTISQAETVSSDLNVMETSEPVPQNVDVEMSDIEQTCINETSLPVELNKIEEITNCTNNDIEVDSSELDIQQSPADMEMKDCLEGTESKVDEAEIPSEHVSVEPCDSCEVSPSEPLVSELPDSCEVAPCEPLVSELPDGCEVAPCEPLVSELSNSCEVAPTEPLITELPCNFEIASNKLLDSCEVSSSEPLISELPDVSKIESKHLRLITNTEQDLS